VGMARADGMALRARVRIVEEGPVGSSSGRWDRPVQGER